jgi:hypothetical protein
MLKAIAAAWLLLFFGDLISTFAYHVPEHAFGSLHLKTHHSAKKDFRHYAILMLNYQVLLDGLLGAVSSYAKLIIYSSPKLQSIFSTALTKFSQLSYASISSQLYLIKRHKISIILSSGE